jgi:type I restriction enzyme S subunit
MGSEWEDTTIADLINSGNASLQTGPFGTALKAAEYAAEGVPLISVREIRHGYFELTEHTPFVNEKTLERLPKFILRQGDIVFGRKGAVDRSAMIQKNQDGWFLGSDGIRLRLEGCCDHRFISYQVRSPAIQNWLMQHAEGTTMLSMNQKVLGRVPLTLPPLPEQKAIAHILGSLDDKIELNRRMNAMLEGMAQALFKSWFVDFDPVIDNALAGGKEIPAGLSEKAQTRAALGDKRRPLPEEIRTLFPDEFSYSDPMGWIPKGWEVMKSEEVASISIGKTPPRKQFHWFSEEPEGNLIWVSIRDLGNNGVFIGDSSEYLTPESVEKFKVKKAPKGSVLLSFKLTVGRVAIAQDELTTNEAIAHFVEPKYGLTKEYISVISG